MPGGKGFPMALSAYEVPLTPSGGLLSNEYICLTEKHWLRRLQLA
jgi:hypothetical protein